MSAMVLGKRNSSSFFEDSNSFITKKARFGPSSSSLADSVNGSEPEENPTSFERLRFLFPDFEEQVIRKEFESCDHDLDSAIKSLEKIRCRSRKEDCDTDISKWVDPLVREMMNATDINDARHHASSMLKGLKELITAQANIRAAETIGKENVTLKEQVEGLQHDNNILKRAVAIQHERQKEFQTKAQQVNLELQHLRELVGQYQQQIRTLEINNYSLSMHLRQAQQSSSMPGRFHPDVF